MKLSVQLIACVVLALIAERAAVAGKGGSAGSAKGASSRAGYATQSGPKIVGYSSKPSRSALRYSQIKPSEKLRAMIYQKQNSTTTYLGTALLVSLLAEKSLSTSDRRWLQSQIGADSTGETENKTLLHPEVLPLKNKRIFVFQGLEQPLQVGDTVKITVSASNNGVASRVSCDDQRAREHNGKAEIQWIAEMPAVFLLSCSTDWGEDRRLVKILPKTDTQNEKY